MIWLIDAHLDKSIGFPDIKNRINQQLSIISTQSQNFGEITIGRTTHTKYSIYTTNSVKGYFQYDAEQNGDSMTLFVYWQKDFTNCEIQKIKMGHKYGGEEFKTIWDKP
jgi:hypothetical protein